MYVGTRAAKTFFSFSHHTTMPRRRAEWKSFALLVSTFSGENKGTFSVRLNLSELFRLRSVKIRRFKGCEYVYVNGESLKIYINLWIYGAEQNAAVV